MNRYSEALAPDTGVIFHEPIETDRDLLREFGMSDSDAAAFLGRTRQALHQKLGRKGDRGSRGSLKASDVLILASAARQLGKPFNGLSVLDYIRRAREDQDPEAFALLEALLKDEIGDIDININAASAVVLVLPSFADMLARFQGIGEALKRIVREVRRKSKQAIVIGPTITRARMAGDFLGVDDDRCFGHELADLYLPTIVLFGAKDPAVFVLAETGRFVGAPPFSRANMSQNVLAMLPQESREELA